MPSFEWQGLTAAGRVETGRTRAANAEALVATLQRRHIQLLRWQAAATAHPARHRQQRAAFPGHALAQMTRQLAVMVRAGLPVVRALAALETQPQQRRGTNVIGSLRARLEAGEPLAHALREYPATFPPLYCAMVAAGEATGDMEQVLAQLAAHLERAAALRRKLLSALLYPTLVLVVAGLVTGGLLIFVVPVFAELFAAFGQDLPLPTRLVLHASKQLTATFPWLVLGGAGGVVATRRCLRRAGVRRRADRMLLRLPLLGRALQRAEIARLTRVLGTLVVAGVPLLESIRIAAEAAHNTTYRDALAHVDDAIRQGEPLATSLAHRGLFPHTVTQLIGVGEATGTLEAALLRVAELYEGELDHLLGNLTALIEPAFVALLGTVVGAILLSLYLPIFQIGALVQ